MDTIYVISSHDSEIDDMDPEITLFYNEKDAKAWAEQAYTNNGAGWEYYTKNAEILSNEDRFHKIIITKELIR